MVRLKFNKTTWWQCHHGPQGLVMLGTQGHLPGREYATLPTTNQCTQENKCTVSHERKQEKLTLRSHKSHQEKVVLSGSHVGRQTGALNQLFSTHTGFKVKGGCSERTNSGLDRDMGIVTNRRTEILQLTSTTPAMFLIH